MGGRPRRLLSGHWIRKLCVHRSVSSNPHVDDLGHRDLVGMAIPLAVRILRQSRQLDTTLTQVMSLDYIGAFLASLAFPFVVLPELGLILGGFLVGILNVAKGLYLLYRVRQRQPRLTPLHLPGWTLITTLTMGFVLSNEATEMVEDHAYQNAIIFADTSNRQRLVVTRWRNDTRLYLNGHL